MREVLFDIGLLLLSFVVLHMVVAVTASFLFDDDSKGVR